MWEKYIYLIEINAEKDVKLQQAKLYTKYIKKNLQRS